MSGPDRVRVVHVSQVFGSPHGGSAYSQAMVDTLSLHGAEVTLLAERFEDGREAPGSGRARRVTLPRLFRSGRLSFLTRAVDVARLWRIALSAKRTVVIVQGDLPRLNYVFLQMLVPLIFIRQDTILTCPANHRLLPHSRTVCLKPPGFSCLKVDAQEKCLGHLKWWHRVGRIVFRLRDRFLLRRMRHFVVNSQATHERHGRNAMVLHPPNLSSTPSGRPAERDLGQIVFCGRLSEEKGAAEAIRILSALPSAYHLAIAGDGPREALEEEATRLGIADRVRFHGWLPAAERDALLAISGVLLMPSLCHEGFGMAGIEAFAQGTPVVAYDVGGIAEWCTPNAGLLTPCGDIAGAAIAVQHLTEDPVRWQEYSDAAREICEVRFRPGRFAQEVLSMVRGATGYALN